eukprot:TRINITY_DN3671_c0_g1_i1.p1 TRINITY_DN3671_c0_g1~~TRINITY_DN3671_c0_g1_i1.p1  ORF type:complete len:304 (+),score=106.56 TRINITY_DN3671_c0_g1_i1:127-1038(+)
MPNFVDYAGKPIPELFFTWAEDMENRGFDYHEAMDAILEHGSYGNALAWIVNHPRKKALAFKLGLKKVIRYPRRAAAANTKEFVAPERIVYEKLVHAPVVPQQEKKPQQQRVKKEGGLKELRHQRRNSDSLVTGSIKMMGNSVKVRKSSLADAEEGDDDKDESVAGEKRQSLDQFIPVESSNKRGSSAASVPAVVVVVGEDSKQETLRKSVKNLFADPATMQGMRKRSSLQEVFGDALANPVAVSSEGTLLQSAKDLPKEKTIVVRRSSSSAHKKVLVSSTESNGDLKRRQSAGVIMEIAVNE